MSANGPVEVTEVVAEALSKAWTTVLLRQPSTYMSVVILAVVVAVLVPVNGGNITASVIAGIVLLVLLIFTLRISTRRATRKRIALMLPVGSDVSAHIELASLHVSGPIGAGNMLLSGYACAWVNQDALILKYAKQRLFQVVPRQALADDDLALLRTQIEVRDL